MERATGGIVSPGDLHRIGDDCCSHCPLFPDAECRFYLEGSTGNSLVIYPVKTDMTTEEVEEEIRKSMTLMLKIHKAEF